MRVIVILTIIVLLAVGVTFIPQLVWKAIMTTVLILFIGILAAELETLEQED